LVNVAVRDILTSMLGITLVVSSAMGDSSRALVEEGNARFLDGEVEAALERYDAARELDPEVLEAVFNAGVANVELGDRARAERLFRMVDAAGDVDEDLAARARYNLGRLLADDVALPGMEALQGDLDQAFDEPIETLRTAASFFRGAYQYRPDDPEIRRNLELTRRKLREALQQKQQMQDMQEQLRELAEQMQETAEQQEQEAQQNSQPQQQSGQQQQQQQQQQQEQLSEQTQQLQQQLEDMLGEGSPQQQQGGERTPQQAMQEAREAQQRAEERLEQNDMEGAAEQQQQAAERLREAADQLQQQQQPQEGEGEQQEQQQQQPQDSDGEQEGQAEPAQPQPGEQTSDRMEDLVQQLLDREEQRNARENERQGPGRREPVEKDW
jgi:chemotaxis protein histidine kinase CheA